MFCYYNLAKSKSYKLTRGEYTLLRTNIKIYNRSSNEHPVYFIIFNYFSLVDVVQTVLLYKKQN